MLLYNQIVEALTAELYGNESQTERAIRAKAFIDNNFSQALTLDTISRAVHSSKFHLNREFKRHYGQTPAQYLKEKRIQEAKRLLNGDTSVSDACYSVGYESLSTFSILFRRMTGVSPGKIKKARMKK
jgi:AraC-like DNA-binding protein